MKLVTPRWWYVRENAPMPLTRALLRPASWALAAVTARRIARTTPFDPGIPVICVGGLSVGGAGKTPVAQALLQRLRGLGIEAAALSRGYGGDLKDPTKVDPTLHTADEVGDEPLMLAAEGPAWAARDRVAGARAAVADGAGILVLDDGHQNPSLKKTLSIVAVDGETRNGEWPFGDGSVFPSGPLREPLAMGLARADAVVVVLPTDLDEADPELLKVFAHKPVLVARLEPAGAAPTGPLFAFAGIAKPWRFEQSLRAAGAQIADFAPYPDHARFEESTLGFLADRAKALGATLVCTEKDWVRLPPQWRAKVQAWPVKAVFENEAALDALP